MAAPKVPIAPRRQLTGFQGKRQRRTPRRRFNPEGFIGEVGTQLTPKGPYGSASDIASDVKESERLAGKITGTERRQDPVTGRTSWQRKVGGTAGDQM